MKSLWRRWKWRWTTERNNEMWREMYSKLANENAELRSQVSVRDDLIAALRIDVARGGHR